MFDQQGRHGEGIDVVSEPTKGELLELLDELTNRGHGVEGPCEYGCSGDQCAFCDANFYKGRDHSDECAFARARKLVDNGS